MDCSQRRKTAGDVLPPRQPHPTNPLHTTTTTTTTTIAIISKCVTALYVIYEVASQSFVSKSFTSERVSATIVRRCPRCEPPAVRCCNHFHQQPSYPPACFGRQIPDLPASPPSSFGEASRCLLQINRRSERQYGRCVPASSEKMRECDRPYWQVAA